MVPLVTAPSPIVAPPRADPGPARRRSLTVSAYQPRMPADYDHRASYLKGEYRHCYVNVM